MRTMRPELDAPIIRIAEHQDEYETVEGALVTHPAFRTRNILIKDVREDAAKKVDCNTFLYAFVPDGGQLKNLLAGEAIYIGLLTGGHAPQPILVLVGKHEAAQVYNVRAT